jgi:hypothetical protein
MKPKKLPPDVAEFFRRQGSRGGKKAAESLTAEERKERARKAPMALSADERKERAQKAVAAREAKRKRRPAKRGKTK